MKTFIESDFFVFIKYVPNSRSNFMDLIKKGALLNFNRVSFSRFPCPLAFQHSALQDFFGN